MLMPFAQKGIEDHYSLSAMSSNCECIASFRRAFASFVFT
jgi:hypothetical protein